MAEEPREKPAEDKDARWTKKHGKSFYGYKIHVNADAKHKLIRHYEVTDASVHDSRSLWASEQDQHVCERIRGQRVSLGRDRGEAQDARLAQSHSSARRGPLGQGGTAVAAALGVG